ncbi:MAG: CubicO group peptidase (beta-lactamase class C family) [Porticoccaceae bacterium]|jgi:CubicO group peptidase (beta-lactamase class C family)
MLNFRLIRVFATLLGLTLNGLVLAQESQEQIEATSILFWSQAQKEQGFLNIDKILPTRKIHADNDVLELPLALQDLSSVSYSLAGVQFTLQEHMSSQHVGGLLVLQRGNLVYENYGLDNNEESLWVAFSVAKSITSMLIGAAIQDGYINSVQDQVTDYLPRLKGSAYDAATIENVLHMASGVAWNEDYFDPESDVSIAGGSNAMELFQHLNTLDVSGKPGEVFNYSTGETNLVGAILRAAIGNNESAYLEQKIWQPFGMESDANWVIDSKYGTELGGCCLNATLRDYARIGLFALSGGVLADGTRILPEGWMKASTTPSKGYEGYGYLWWLMPDGTYAAQGIFGQLIWIDPATETIIVTHSAWPKAVGETFTAHRWAMVGAIRAAIQPTSESRK